MTVFAFHLYNKEKSIPSIILFIIDNYSFVKIIVPFVHIVQIILNVLAISYLSFINWLNITLFCGISFHWYTNQSKTQNNLICLLILCLVSLENIEQFTPIYLSILCTIAILSLIQASSNNNSAITSDKKKEVVPTNDIKEDNLMKQEKLKVNE